MYYSCNNTILETFTFRHLQPLFFDVEECKKELWTVEYCDLSDKRKKNCLIFHLMKLVRLYQISRQEISAGNYDNYKTRCFAGY